MQNTKVMSVQCASAMNVTRMNGVKLNERKNDYAKISKNRKIKRDEGR